MIRSHDSTIPNILRDCYPEGKCTFKDIRSNQTMG